MTAARATDPVTAAELVEITGKSRAATQAAALARMGIPFSFLGRSIVLERAIAEAHAALPQRRVTGVDLSRVK